MTIFCRRGTIMNSAVVGRLSSVQQFWVNSTAHNAVVGRLSSVQQFWVNQFLADGRPRSGLLLGLPGEEGAA